MKLCVTSQGDGLNAAVDPKFGRCQYFIIIDTETGGFEAVQNPNLSGMGGVGIQSGQLIAAKGVKTLLTGNVGPNAFRTLQAASVEVITGISGTVGEAVDRYKKSEFKSAKIPSVDSKFGAS